MKRAAIIGCGTIFQVHLPIIVANPEIELCAVCDNNPAVQEKLPAAAKAVPFYTDYEELLEKEHPDVVHLCLPHYLHVPVSEYFASHGVNVFCETEKDHRWRRIWQGHRLPRLCALVPRQGLL